MTYSPLTEAQIEQIRSCIQHGIDLAALRDEVRATWPTATGIQIQATVEYDDGSSYYWRVSDMSILGKDGQLASSDPCDPAQEDAFDDLRHNIRLGSASGEDGDDTVLVQFDTPTLDQLYQAI